MILETHRILCDGIGKGDVVCPGRYRDFEVAVAYGKPGEKMKRSLCIRASVVPKYMGDLVGELGKETAEAERRESVDPCTLAARYHHQFAMLHPFGDGNGRMARLLMNVLLLKYAGHVAPFGGEEGKKEEEYLEVVTREKRVWEEQDMEVGFEQQTGHVEFAGFVLKKLRGGLEDLCSSVLDD